MNEVKDRQHAGMMERDALLRALQSFSRGDFSVRLPFEDGIDAEIATAFNAAAEAQERLSRRAAQLAERMQRFERPPPSGKPGLLAGQAQALRLSMNSMLTLAKLLADNEENNLSAKQIDYAQTIYSAGTDLLGIIDELVTDAGLEPATPAAAMPGGYGDVRALAVPTPFLRRRDAAGRQPYRGRRSRRLDDGMVLVAHRDAAVAKALFERMRASGYQAGIATELAALRTLLREYRPDAIFVGTALSDCDGWTVLELLASDPETSRLPVSMIWAQEGRHACLELPGGVQELESLSDSDALVAIRETMAGAAQGAFGTAESGPANLPERAATDPAILRRGRDLDETLLQAVRFVQEVVGMPPPTRRRVQSRRRRSQLDLVGKKILIVDGDIRDIYAMTGALEQQGMLVMHAENGEQGVALLESNPDTNAVVVDATLPEPDDCRAIRLMRGRTGLEALPIIALTKQATRANRDECIAAGASDCLAKPIDDEQLIALLRAWLLTPR